MTAARCAWALGAAAFAIVACRAPAPHEASARAVPEEPAAAPASAEETAAPVAPPPSAEPSATRAIAPVIEGGFRELTVPGFRPAVAFVPPGPQDARFPLAVVTHGAGGMSEPHCEHWAHLLGSRAYVVCPRGTAIGFRTEGAVPTGYFYRDHRALGREVMGARAAAIEAFGARLDPSRALYAGFSQGATMGALFLHELADTPERGAFARLVMVDGGWLEWTLALARKEAESGLARVLLVCGQGRCATEGRQRAAWMAQAGLPARLEHAAGAGHTWGGAVTEKVQGSLAWLLEDDPRFTVLGAAKTSP